MSKNGRTHKGCCRVPPSLCKKYVTAVSSHCRYLWLYFIIYVMSNNGKYLRLLFELVHSFQKPRLSQHNNDGSVFFHPELHGLESGVTGFTTSLQHQTAWFFLSACIAYRKQVMNSHTTFKNAGAQILH